MPELDGMIENAIARSLIRERIAQLEKIKSNSEANEYKLNELKLLLKRLEGIFENKNKKESS